jgi:hypothetical protein
VYDHEHVVTKVVEIAIANPEALQHEPDELRVLIIDGVEIRRSRDTHAGRGISRRRG